MNISSKDFFRFVALTVILSAADREATAQQVKAVAVPGTAAVRSVGAMVIPRALPLTPLTVQANGFEFKGQLLTSPEAFSPTPAVQAAVLPIAGPAPLDAGLPAVTGDGVLAAGGVRATRVEESAAAVALVTRLESTVAVDKEGAVLFENSRIKPNNKMEVVGRFAEARRSGLGRSARIGQRFAAGLAGLTMAPVMAMAANVALPVADMSPFMFYTTGIAFVIGAITGLGVLFGYNTHPNSPEQSEQLGKLIITSLMMFLGVLVPVFLVVPAVLLAISMLRWRQWNPRVSNAFRLMNKAAWFGAALSALAAVPLAFAGSYGVLALLMALGIAIGSSYQGVHVK